MGSSLGLSDKRVKAHVCQKGQTTESEVWYLGGGTIGKDQE